MLSRLAHYTEYKILILRVVEVYLSDIVEGRGNAYHISIPFTKIYVRTGVGWIWKDKIYYENPNWFYGSIIS